MVQAKLLVVEDDISMREALSDTLEMAGYSVTSAESAERALDLLEQEDVSMVISDVQMGQMDGHSLLRTIKLHNPSLPVLLMTAYGTIAKAVDAMRDGAVDYIVKPFEAEVIINTVGRYVPTDSHSNNRFVAVDAKSKEISVLALKVAGSDATIMITGESGVGKEVLARYIHNNSPRSDQPFIAINCAAIPDNMLEATLFGYEKGAFTGAYKACPGKFELAQGGTLLLDEVTEMELGLQAKLLRVIQEKEVERLGGNKLIELDVRILATSNRSLREEVNSGKFREDLFYRLNVFPIHIPPLRERRDDIIPIAQGILERSAIIFRRSIPTISSEAISEILSHSWPGNVRELDNVLQRALILQPGETITSKDLHFEKFDMEQNISNRTNQSIDSMPTTTPSLGDGIRHHEYNLIIESLKNYHGSRKRTAEALNVSPRTLRYKLSKMREEGIAIPGDYDG